MTNEKNKFYFFILIITLFRLVYINFVPLVPQEAYYWKYAKNLALSYFDHPPMAAYLIALFTGLGGDSIFFIRLASVLFSAGLMLLLYKITLRLFEETTWALQTIIIINCTILFSIGATVITPDVPLLFFWTLFIYFLIRLNESNQARWWYFSGLALGCALLSKYSAILIVPGIFIYLLLSKTQRHWLTTVHPYFGLLSAFIVFMPVIIWNAQHDWVSFAFQSSNRFSAMKRLRLDFFGQLVGSQLFMLTPYLFFFVFGGWFYVGKKSWQEKDDRLSLLFWLSLPVFVVFTAASFRSLAKMNWLAPAYITSIIAGLYWIATASSPVAALAKKLFKPGLILGLILVILMHLLPIVPLVPLRSGDTWTGWKELSQRLLEMKKEMGESTFIFGHEYKIPSQITFYTPQHEETHAGEVIGENGLQYAYWTTISQLIGKNAIFVTSDAQRYKKIDNLERYFERVEQDNPLKISHHGKVFRTFYLYRCYGYKGAQP